MLKIEGILQNDDVHQSIYTVVCLNKNHVYIKVAGEKNALFNIQ